MNYNNSKLIREIELELRMGMEGYTGIIPFLYALLVTHSPRHRFYTPLVTEGDDSYHGSYHHHHQFNLHRLACGRSQKFIMWECGGHYGFSICLSCTYLSSSIDVLCKNSFIQLIQLCIHAGASLWVWLCQICNWIDVIMHTDEVIMFLFKIIGSEIFVGGLRGR